MTGLTEEMRSNFNLMKSINNITKGGAKVKMDESIQIIKNFYSNEKCKELMEKFGVKVA